MIGCGAGIPLAHALKGQNMTAQGNALGNKSEAKKALKGRNKIRLVDPA